MKFKVGNRRYDIFNLVVFVVMLYFYFGKVKLFGLFGISTDYLFWILLAIILIPTIFLKIFSYPLIKVNNLPFILYTFYLIYEMLRGEYVYNARTEFIFFIIIVLYFLTIESKSKLNHFSAKLFEVGGLYYTITVLLQAIIPNLVNTARKIVLLDVDYDASQRGYENTTNYLSGLASNSAVAAYFISIYIAILIAKVLISENNRMKNLILAGFGFFALLLTQKRSLLLGVAISIAIIVCMLKKGLQSKIKYILLFLFVGVVAFYIMISYVPAMQIFLTRLIENNDLWSGRSTMYETMMEWFRSNPLFGVGIGTAKGMWGYGGHNCYFQLLGETGIIGCVLYGLILIPLIIRTYKMTYIFWNNDEFFTAYKEETQELLGTSISVTIILIYAITGNPFYDYTLSLAMFTLLAIPNQIKSGLLDKLVKHQRKRKDYPQIKENLELL